MKSIEDYRALITRVDLLCRRVYAKYAGSMSCRKECAGNCCRIHLSLYPIEAVSMAQALSRRSRELQGRIHLRAARTTSFGPCPLLDDGACLLYESRLIICRTHGFPMATEYRGHRSEGCCVLNFRDQRPFPEDAVVDLDPINRELAAVNRLFVAEFPGGQLLSSRYTMAEALQLDLTPC